MNHYLAIGIGAFFGANLRYLIADFLASRLGTAFPYGTLVVNVSGSLAIGLFIALATERLAFLQAMHMPLVVGFLGAYTTFSALSYDCLSMLESRQYLAAAGNLLANVLLGFVAVAVGTAIGRLWPSS